MMESTPVWGVESKNAVVAALLAPCWRREAATGMTPQEQSGSGTPNKLALKTETRLGRPRCLSSQEGEMNTERSPATTNPSNKKAAISVVTCQMASTIFQAISIKSCFFLLTFFFF